MTENENKKIVNKTDAQGEKKAPRRRFPAKKPAARKSAPKAEAKADVKTAAGTPEKTARKPRKAALKAAKKAEAPKAAAAPKAKKPAAKNAPVKNAPAKNAPAKNLPGKQNRHTGRRRISAPAAQADKPIISATLQLVGKKPPTMRSRASEHPSRATLRMIPLGGMCEIGKNMTAYEYGSDIIIVDCGQSFPDETMPGVDSVIPDFTYVLQNRDRVRGIFITHGHEDHIGGLPYLLREFKAPVYGGRMAVEASVVFPQPGGP